MRQVEGPTGTSAIAATHAVLGSYRLCGEGVVPLLFTENSTNHARLHLDYPDADPYFKDGINDYVVHGRQEAVNPERSGTKAAAHYRLKVAPGRSATVRLRLTAHAQAGPRAQATGSASPFGQEFDETFTARRREADAFYKSVTPPSVPPDAASVMRQALAGMLWSKQYYYWDGNAWLAEHSAHPLHRGSRDFRNREWFHMVNDDIISMPDKWEYPWYAAWDLAFHTLPIGIVDPEFAREQLHLMLRGVYLHPSGQIPAYEWNFSDVNPPVHAFATLFLHRTELALRGEADLDFLKAAFAKLMLNFTWWVNRKDRFGKNIFEGGFLGLDNIGVFDRSAPLPTGGHLEQLGTPALWLLPVTFPMVMALGGMIGLLGVPLPGIEVGIAASAILLGLAVMGELRPPLAMAVALVAVFGVFHGHAHGTELPVGQNALAYSMGFVIATGCLHGVGIAIGTIHGWPWGQRLLRVAGGGVALAGVMFLWRAIA